VDVRRGRGPLGNAFPLAPGASRSAVCSAFARVLNGEDPAHVARDREGPALRIYTELASPAADARRRRAIALPIYTEARQPAPLPTPADGEPSNTSPALSRAGDAFDSCACAFPSNATPSRSLSAKHVRVRAEALAEATEARRLRQAHSSYGFRRGRGGGKRGRRDNWGRGLLPLPYANFDMRGPRGLKASVWCRTKLSQTHRQARFKRTCGTFSAPEPPTLNSQIVCVYALLLRIYSTAFGYNISWRTLMYALTLSTHLILIHITRRDQAQVKPRHKQASQEKHRHNIAGHTDKRRRYVAVRRMYVCMVTSPCAVCMCVWRSHGHGAWITRDM
jgi:hypothetical protein